MKCSPVLYFFCTYDFFCGSQLADSATDVVNNLPLVAAIAACQRLLAVAIIFQQDLKLGWRR